MEYFPVPHNIQRMDCIRKYEERVTSNRQQWINFTKYTVVTYILDDVATLAISDSLLVNRNRLLVQLEITIFFVTVISGRTNTSGEQNLQTQC